MIMFEFMKFWLVMWPSAVWQVACEVLQCVVSRCDVCIKASSNCVIAL